MWGLRQQDANQGGYAQANNVPMNHQYIPRTRMRPRTPSPENYYHPMIQRNVASHQGLQELKLHTKHEKWEDVWDDFDDGRETPRDQWGMMTVNGNEAHVRNATGNETPPRDQRGMRKANTAQQAPNPFRGAQQKAQPQGGRIQIFPDDASRQQQQQQQHPMWQGSAPAHPPQANPSRMAQAPQPQPAAGKAKLSIASLVDPPPPPQPLPGQSRADRMANKPKLSIAELVDGGRQKGPGQEGHPRENALFSGQTKKLPFETQTNSHAQVSIGSVGHPHSCGDPCKYVLKSRGCKDGAACVRCHLCKWSRYAH
jgi:hypothetical protein